MRIIVGIIFMTGHWKHLQGPQGRSKVEMHKGFAIFPGAAEFAGGLGVILGVLAQPAALGLTLIMLGAIQKRIFVWHTGFWGKSGSNGWSYDTMSIEGSQI
jgi:putative oxidoreductase